MSRYDGLIEAARQVSEPVQEIGFDWVKGEGEEINDKVRADRFVQLLSKCESKAEIAAQCSDLYQWLKSNYRGTRSAVKGAEARMTHYRAAIAKLDISSLPQFAIGADGKHYALSQLLVSAQDAAQGSSDLAEKEQDERQRQSAKRQRLEASNAIDVGMLIAKAIEMMQHSKSEYIALGVAIVTGRRVAEVCVTGTFQADDTYTLRFSGQGKKKTEEQRDALRSIPCLVDSNLIEAAVERLRELEPPAKYYKSEDPTEAFNNGAFYKRISRKFTTELQPYFDEAGFVEKSSTHKLRAVYVLTIVESYKKLHPHTDIEAFQFAQRCMGHEQVDTTALYKAIRVQNIPDAFRLQLTDDEVGIIDAEPAPIPHAIVSLAEVCSYLDKDSAAKLIEQINQGDNFARLVAKAITSERATIGIKSGSVRGMAPTIAEAIKAYNQRPGVEPVAITKNLISLVNEAIRGSKISAQSFEAMPESFHLSIDAYNESQGFGEKHNLKFRGKDAVTGKGRLETIVGVIAATVK